MKSFLKRKKTVKPEADGSPSRITNETVAEHREKVLAGGRKFKYPLQYQKHKLVINSIVIGVAAVVLLAVLGWHQLYVAQNSSKLIYRITQLIPVGVANVDGESVRYSDYLVRYRSAIFYAQKEESIDLATKDGQCQAAYHRRQALNTAERTAYANKLARDLRVEVTSKEIDDFIAQDIKAQSVSLNAYEKTVLNSYFDWSLDEYRGIIRGELLSRKVAFAIDTDAQKRANELLQKVRGGADFAAVAKESSDDDTTKSNGGDVGVVPVANLDTNGLVAAAQKLEVNKVSDLIQGVDGYYFIRLIEKNENSVHYQQIKIDLTVFEERLQTLSKDGKTKEYIQVDRADCSQSTTGQ